MKKRRIKMTILVLVPVIAHLLGVLSSISAVMTTRTSQGAIAWVISLNTFPYIALPAYWIFGRSKFEGYESAKKSTDENLQQGLQKVIAGLDPYRVDLSEAGGGGLAAQRLADLPFLKGNKVDLLVDGEATFESILSGIDEAQEYILFQFFIVHDDEIGREVKTRLLKKAAEGVNVYFLFDEIGSLDLSDSYKNELREGGCYVFPFNTRKGKRNRFQLNFRNHRKIVVVDGHTAWVGGHNVGDEYLGKDPKFGHWRDTHVRIVGPAALAPQLAFAEDWYWATDEILLDLHWTAAEVEGGDKPVLVVPSGPADEYETASLMFLHAINSAQKRIWIASPYFVPDDAIVSALQLAGLRGVDVRILIPDEPDHLLVYLAAFSYFDDAGLTGVKFFRYTDGFLHEKVMLIDEQLATVGTANFDNRSFRLNFEITALVADKDFAAEVEQMFLTDFEHSREMAENEFDEKPFWFRLSSRLARLTAPIQ